MKFVVASAHRNTAGAQARRWMHQLVALKAELRNHYYCSFRAVAVEGDSTDNTRKELVDLALAVDIDLELRTCNHDGPVYGSTEQPERMAALSKVGNAIFDAVRPDDDVLVYVESDLVWEAETIRKLIDYVIPHRIQVTQHQDRVPSFVDGVCDADVVAPMVFAGDNHYDIWALRGLDGVRFSPSYPYHESLSRKTSLTEVSSAGSCLVMSAEVARRVRILNDNALVGWCEEARRQGYRIWVAPELRIRHSA